MIVFLLKRLILLPITLFFLITITFFLIRFTPGGPFSAERRLDPVVEKALRMKFHMDKPLVTQYFLYMKDLLKGDLGPSSKHKSTSVNEIIASTLPHSFLLGSLAIIIAVIVGCIAGVIAAARQNNCLDYVTMIIAVMGLSLPAFVIAPLFQLLFSMKLNWLPVAGYEGLDDLSYLVLPAITLSLPFAARIARLMRGGMLEVIHQDFIRTAYAKGLRERVVIIRHAFKGGLIPVLTFLGPAIAAVMTGTLVIERVFHIPGLGREFVEAALNRDYTLVSGTVIVYGTFLILCNLLSDLLCAWADPRVRC